MERFTRIYSYIEEYQRLILDFYSKVHTAFLVTYYSLDSTATIWDNELLMSGSYEKIGNFSGIKWKRIILLPVFFIEEISTQFDGQEIGYIKENFTSFVIPSSYGLIPKPNDIIKLEQSYLRSVNDTYPLFIVTGLEKSSNTDKTFWKIRVEVEQSRTKNEIDQQVTESFVFLEYFKRIYSIEDAEFIIKLLYKNDLLREKLDEKYDKAGLYFL